MKNYFKELLKLLRSIDARLASLEKCISKENHRGKHCILTGHWNER